MFNLNSSLRDYSYHDRTRPPAAGAASAPSATSSRKEDPRIAILIKQFADSSIVDRMNSIIPDRLKPAERRQASACASYTPNSGGRTLRFAGAEMPPISQDETLQGQVPNPGPVRGILKKRP
ncbi:MAG: hypothetical protein WCF65_08160 [Parachlamydiaceae bacterium]